MKHEAIMVLNIIHFMSFFFMCISKIWCIKRNGDCILQVKSKYQAENVIFLMFSL